MVKILIVKTSALGDIVHLYPTIQFLKKIYPESQIDWVVERGGAALVAEHPLVNQTFVIDSKQWRKGFFSQKTWQEASTFWKALRQNSYDLIFDFQANTKSGLIALIARGLHKIGFGKDSVFERFNLLCTHFKHDPHPGLNARQEYLSLVEAWSKQKAPSLPLTRLKLNKEEKVQLSELIQKKGERNLMICPGSIWPNKQLDPADLLAFLQKINFSGKLWLVFGNDREKEIIHFLKSHLPQAEIVPKLSLPLLQHWMAEMDQVIAMDSLPLHLAAEAGTPTFSFFGASAAQKYRPLGAIHHSFQGTCPYGRQFDRRCPILRSCPTGACIHKLDQEKLVNLYNKLL